RSGIAHHLARPGRQRTRCDPGLRRQGILPSNGCGLPRMRTEDTPAGADAVKPRRPTMLVRRGEHVDLEARAKAEPADDVLTRDYYTLRPQLRLTADLGDEPTQPEVPTEVMLDGNDVARLVEC